MSTPRGNDQRDRGIGDDQGRRHDAGGKREIIHGEERRDEFDAVEREGGDAVGVRTLPGFCHRRAETQHADDGREPRRGRWLARQKKKYEDDRRGQQEGPFVPWENPLAAPKAHQAQQQTNNRGDAHDPAARPGRFIDLHQIGGAGENAENQPGQRRGGATTRRGGGGVAGPEATKSLPTNLRRLAFYLLSSLIASAAQRPPPPRCWRNTVPLPRYRGGGNYYSAAALAVRCGRRSRKCGKISSAIAVMLARAISFGMVPNWVLVSQVLKPARS